MSLMVLTALQWFRYEYELRGSAGASANVFASSETFQLDIISILVSFREEGILIDAMLHGSLSNHHAKHRAGYLNVCFISCYTYPCLFRPFFIYFFKLCEDEIVANGKNKISLEFVIQ
ncbi:hypothetical protein LOK82_13900 [Xylella fastidiosa subsp. multiplex]|uniref:Uncharacterized protein n=1 Tax=Xylella fastidiosa subsp. multiplex TaxID=644357 RepID=A0AAW6HXX8_XYLFS|nr:hypothetical protein [Xylella fastidiosa subsp. multiplex]